MRVVCQHSSFTCANACKGLQSDGRKTGSLFEKFVRECDSGDGLLVAPVKGDALLFYSMSPDGKLDRASYHGGCPVLEGEKWGANVWVWNRDRPTFDNDKSNKRPSKNAIKLVFANSHPKPVGMYWLDRGTMQLFETIQPGGEWVVDTHPGHIWVAKAGEVEVKRWVVDRKMNTAVHIP